MVLVSLIMDTQQEGLRKLGGDAYSMKQNLVAKVETPVLEEGRYLWFAFLASKTLNLYGDVNQDNRLRFKIDHAFDLSKIVQTIQKLF